MVRTNTRSRSKPVLPSYNELRLPVKLIEYALSNKLVKQLRILLCLKLIGHRCERVVLQKCLRMQKRTLARNISKLTKLGWAGTDGFNLYPRSWHRLNFGGKRVGLYMTSVPSLKKFEALCFTIALKSVYRKKKINRKKGSPRSNTGRALQMDFPAGYLYKSMRLRQRTFERLKASAQRYRFISVKPQFIELGKKSEYAELRKNLKDVKMFVRGNKTVSPRPSLIKILI